MLHEIVFLNKVRVLLQALNKLFKAMTQKHIVFFTDQKKLYSVCIQKINLFDVLFLSI
jgi:hypothetical protein